LDYTFFAGVQHRFQIPIAKILFTALDDEARVSRVARHAEDERLGLRRRQVFSHAPSSRFCTSFKKTRRGKYLVRRVRIRARDIKGGTSCAFQVKINASENPFVARPRGSKTVS